MSYYEDINNNRKEIVELATKLDNFVRTKYNITSDDGYTCDIMRALHQAIEKGVAIEAQTLKDINTVLQRW